MTYQYLKIWNLNYINATASVVESETLSIFISGLKKLSNKDNIFLIDSKPQQTS